MNYKIVRLLFDPRGTSNKKEFLLGILILFLLVLYYIHNLILDMSLIYLIGNKGAEILASYQIINTSPTSIPILPVSFILFYSAIVLAIKRVKDIGKNLWIGILTGLCIFLFFNNTFLNLPFYITLTDTTKGFKISDQVQIFQIAIRSLIALFGLVSLGFLLTLKGTKPSEKEIKERGVLTISQFITQLGKLCIAIIILPLPLCLLNYFYSIDELLLILSSITLLIFLCWYLILVYQRLKNAAKTFYPFILCFITYALSLIFVVFIFSKSSSLNLTSVTLSIFSVIKMIFTLANLSLFLLKETVPNINE